MKQTADQIIYNGTLVTMDPKKDVIENGALVVIGSCIAALGKTEAILAEYRSDRMLDASGHVVMPGLINTHAHLATVLLRGLAEDLPLESWLHKVWLAEKAVMTAENVEAAARLAMCELALGGTTCAVDMYWFPQAAARAAAQMGFRLINGPVFLEMDNPPDGMSFADRISFAREYAAHYQEHTLVHPMLMPHSTHTDSPDDLKKIKTLAEQLGLGLHIHTAETNAEVREVQARSGQTPIQLLHSLGLLDEQILLAHCVHVSPEEIDLIARAKAGVAHNPISNMKLSSGFAPITRMQEQGVRLSIGTDGAQSSNDLDMWWSLRLAALLQKGIQREATVMKAKEVLQMVTIGAARCIGLEEEIGSLEAGKKADLILLQRNAPHLTPLHNIYAHLVYAYGREDVDSVMINGQWVMRERKMQHVDATACMQQVNAIAHQIH